jgi:aldehyde:ferredoxin oxidoreductase
MLNLTPAREKENIFMYGWMGKILRVDLSKAQVSQFSTQPYAEQFLGGRGIAAKIYWETIKPETKAFDPENRLIFMTGPLVATGAQGATQLSVVGKSPMTLPEGFCYGSFGGYAGAELKKAGFDGIVIEGRSPKPVYLWVHDGEAELRDASALWGENGYRSGEMLKQAYGEKTQYITIGVSGENLVRTANALASFNCTVCAGFGAVMGSKNLKAIAILGTGNVSVANPDGLQDLVRYTLKLNRGLMKTFIPPRFMATDHGHLLEVVGKSHCYKCGLECIREIYRYNQCLSGYGKCQSMEYYMPWLHGREDEPLETIFYAPIMVNDYCLDSQELQNMIDWLYACFKAGVLTEDQTGLPLSKMGTMEFLKKLFHMIIYRQGFGDVLADGMVRIGSRVSDKARALFPSTVAPIGMKDLASPRTYIVNGLLSYLEPRLHQNLMHENIVAVGGWMRNHIQPGSTPVNSRVLRDIARIFWGSEAAADVTSYEGKALAAKMIQNRTCLKESLGLCDFACPTLYSYNSPDNLGDPDLEARIFNAVTGIDGKELERYGERIFNLQRMILLREGRRVPQADYPADINFIEPYQGMPGTNDKTMMVPGPGDTSINVIGNVLDRKKYKIMLKEYYRLRGWDDETGLQQPETLAALGLDKLVTR